MKQILKINIDMEILKMIDRWIHTFKRSFFFIRSRELYIIQ